MTGDDEVIVPDADWDQPGAAPFRLRLSSAGVHLDTELFATEPELTRLLMEMGCSRTQARREAARLLARGPVTTTRPSLTPAQGRHRADCSVAPFVVSKAR